jgi:hypothetical protein
MENEVMGALWTIHIRQSCANWKLVDSQSKIIPHQVTYDNRIEFRTDDIKKGESSVYTYAGGLANRPILSWV